MHGKVKLTKRQIKEDKFTTFMLSTKDQISDNWQFVAVGALVVILAIAGINYYVNSKSIATTEAGEKFARALLDYRNGEQQIAISGLNQIVDDYKNEAVAEQAMYLLGKLNLANRNYPEADRFFQLYIDTYNTNPLNRAAAYAGLAVSYENQGQFIKAGDSFTLAANEFIDGPLEGDYLLGALRNYAAAGDKDKAKEKLDLLNEKFTNSEFANSGNLLFHEKGFSSTK